MPAAITAVTRLVHNALVQAQKRKYNPSRGPCSVCLPRTARGSSTSAMSICPMCAILSARNLTGDEGTVAEILDVERQWFVELLCGWDGDEDLYLFYPDAYRAGKKLWKEFNRE